MGWEDVISIGLGLGNTVANVSTASTLQQMKVQQAGQVSYQEFIHSLRNAIFNLKNTAEGVVVGEEASPLKAAGAMCILDYQLSALGLTPDLFPDLPDKEYTATTIRLITGYSKRMYDGLGKDEQKQVDRLVEHTRQLPEYRYYLENVDKARRLQEAKQIVSQDPASFASSCPMAMAAYLGIFALGVLAFKISEVLGSFIMFLGLIAVIVYFVLRVGASRVGAAKQTIKELEGTIDLQQFQALEQRFKTPDEARQAQQKAEQYIENFFGD